MENPQLSGQDQIKHEVMSDNNAQEVLNHLNVLERNRRHTRTRWIWELLQNARDAGATSASIEWEHGEITFRHNGTGFNRKEIARLIFHGSTKVDNMKTIGQYGSGFLTTHVLSPTIEISGQLDEGRSFKFCLTREIGSVEGLSKSMDRAWNNFNKSLSVVSTLDNFTTQFRYPIGDNAVDAVKKGLAMLQRCAPFVIVFNPEFSCIDIKALDKTTSFKVIETGEKDEIDEITVSENEDGIQRDRVYLLAKNAKASVAIPLEPIDSSRECLPINNIPKLFLGFPLVGTENFSFPAVINSFEFTPTPNRDGIFLGQGNNEEVANRKNQEVIEDAFLLLIDLIKYAASSGWCNTYRLTNIRDIADRDWLNEKWLRDTIRKHFIEKISQSPVILNEAGVARAPIKATLPLAENDTDVEVLWGLLNELKGFRKKLPRRDEAAGWCNAVKSWARIADCQVSKFDEVVDGCKLASYVHDVSHDPLVETTTHRLSPLNDALKERTSAINWLDQLIAFLRYNVASEVMHEYCIVPSQEHFLHTLPGLHRDGGIHKKLKDVAGLLEWRIRCELRDIQLTSLDGEAGAGEWNNEYVIGELIKIIQERAEENPDDKFAKTSVKLFAWIVDQKDWGRLHGFPVFAKEGNSDNTTVLYLPRTAPESDVPMAPINAWKEGLQPFHELFPSSRILADAFFEAVPDLNVWQVLNKRGLIKTNVVINKEERFSRFYANDPLEGKDHRTAKPVALTDITDRTKIMEDVRNSRFRAGLFWRFLTEWLVKEDTCGLEPAEAECECGQTHRYFPASWLVPLRENNWIRQRNSDVREYAKAQPLADLLRDNGWEANTLKENTGALKLLEAIDVAHFDLLRAFVAAKPGDRQKQDDILTEILVATGGNLNPIKEFMQDMEDDENLRDHLAERRERRQRVHANRNLGLQVEKWVKKSLEGKGFSVRRTHIGADLEILAETDDVANLELTSGEQSLLIEVKATRGQKVVRMTFKQAETASKRGNSFLLCVVPVESGDFEPELDTVRDNMRFVENIGDRVRPLCNDLDDLECRRSNITDNDFSGVQLEVKAGTARFRVASSVWENDGFPLKDLAKRLSS